MRRATTWTAFALALTASIMLATAHPALAQPASMTTDKPDYAPSKTVLPNAQCNIGHRHLGITSSPCDDIACAAGHHCIPIPYGVACILDSADPCYGISCDVDYHCINGGCYPAFMCDYVSCAVGSYCVSTPIGQGCVPVGVDLCELWGCPEGFHCVNSEGVPGGLACIPDGISCDDISCAEGFHCENTPEGGVCVPNLTCDDISCPEGYWCYDSPEGGVCVPNLTCDDISCSEGYHCVNSPSGPGCHPNDPEAVEPSTWGQIKKAMWR